MVIPDNKMVLHIRRVKTMTGNIKLLQHNLREREDLGKYIDIEKSIYNKFEGTDALDFTDKYEEMIADAKLKRKIQRNASRTIEFVVSTSHEYKKDWHTNSESKAALDSYFEETKQFFKKRYGDVVISSAIHFDETTPHMHLLCVPLVDNGKGGLKFSSSEFVGGKEELRKLHTDFYEQVGTRFGLERGNEGTRTSHSDLMQYKAWETSQRAIMEQEQADITKRDSETKTREHLSKYIHEQILQKSKEFVAYENSFERNVPVLPLPPPMVEEDDRKKWLESVQKIVSSAFRKIHAAYDILKKETEKLKIRLKKVEHDLAYKPLEEIRREREQQAKAQQWSQER